MPSWLRNGSAEPTEQQTIQMVVEQAPGGIKLVCYSAQLTVTA